MSIATLEHVNVTVSDPPRTAALLVTLFGWHIRWHGPARDGGTTYHVGTEDAYVAVYSWPGADPAMASGRLNHIAVLVDDLEGTERRVTEAGYRPHSHGAYEPGRRFYFHDHDGIEFEIVSYS